MDLQGHKHDARESRSLALSMVFLDSTRVWLSCLAKNWILVFVLSCLAFSLKYFHMIFKIDQVLCLVFANPDINIFIWFSKLIKYLDLLQNFHVRKGDFSIRNLFCNKNKANYSSPVNFCNCYLNFDVKPFYHLG